MNNKYLLEISNLGKHYSNENNLKIEIIKNLNFKLMQNSKVAIVGPSGSGKTTFLNIIGLLDSEYDGNFYFKSKDISLCPKNEMNKIRGLSIGFIHQFFHLIPELTVIENVMLPLLINKNEKKSYEISKKLLLEFGLDERINYKPLKLSGGEQQRVALARAMALRPKIMLMDEPFSNIDQDIKEELVSDVRSLLKELAITSIIVTHDQNEAFNLADKVAIMNNGTIQQVGIPYDIYHKPVNKFVANFIGLGTFLPLKKNNKGDFEIPLGPLDNNRIKNELTKFDNLEMLIRPDDIIHNDLSIKKAKILEKQFRGAEFLYKLLYNNEHQILCYAPSHHNHEIGELIGIELDIQHYVIFERR